MNLVETDIAEIVQGVWDAMLGLEIEPVPGIGADSDPNGGADLVTGSVTVTGASDCVVTLQVSCDGARSFAAAMFGMEPDEVSADEVADAVGELTNMVGGNIKSLLPEPSLLSLPTVSRGAPVQVHVPGGGALTEVGLLSGADVVVVQVWSRLSQPDVTAALHAVPASA
jgi:chemotaxis protein CheX